MDKVLETLIALHDLHRLMEEAEKPEYRELGFVLDEQRMEELKKAEEELKKRIPPQVMRRYEALRKRYGRGVAPVIGGVCMNCFSHLPIAFVNKPGKNEKLETCPNCGIYIYWS